MLLSWAVLIVGLTLSAVASTAWARTLESRAADDFTAAAQDVAGTATTVLRRDLDLVAAVGSLVAFDPTMGNARFAQWAQRADILNRYPDVTAVSSVQRVSHDELAGRMDTFEREYGLAPGSLQLVPEGVRSHYCVATFVHLNAQDDDPFAEGFYPDMCPNGEPLDPGMAVARDSGRLTATLDDGDDGGQQYAPVMAVLMPTYVGGVVPATLEERRARWTGFVGATFDGAAVVQSALTGRPNFAVDLAIDGPEGDLQLASFGNSERMSDDFHLELQLEGDAPWQLDVHAPKADFRPPGNQPLAILVGGALLTVLLTLLVRTLAGSQARAIRLAAAKTAELAHLALHDGLTGLANRTLIQDRADQLLVRCRRHAAVGAAMYVDIDGFKEVNDTFGHQAGDALLREIAARLRSVVRDSDTVGRMGGDEFVVLLEGESLVAGAEPVAERVRAVLAEPYVLPDVDETVEASASIGIALGGHATADELLRDADVALYQAKEGGKNRFVVFTPDLHDAVSDRMSLEIDLRRCVEREELFLLYQPTFDLATSTVVGAEALVRWRHPTRGVVLPDDFVPLAEEKGLIRPIGRWVLGEACRQGAQWAASGRPIEVSVNVSARELDDERFVDEVRDALDRSGFDPEWLVLEITETALMHDVHEAAERLRALKELGVRVAVDDFGTGYSSLAALHRFPVDALKIDRSFVAAVAQWPEAVTLLRTIVQLGKALGLATLAEGVEEQDQLDHVAAEQCDRAQGFLLARPLEPDMLWAFVQEHAPTGTGDDTDILSITS